MKTPSDSQNNWDSLREKIIGLGDHSLRKTYYPELQQKLDDLQQSEERFRATFNQAAVGIALAGLDGRWLQINRKLCDTVGYTEEELKNLTFQDITHPDDLKVSLEWFHRVLAGEIRNYSIEKRYIHKNGSTVWINLTVSLVSESSGNHKYLIAVIEDITERKRTEEALRDAYNELDKRVAERTAELVKTITALQEEVADRITAEQALQAEMRERMRTMEELRRKDQMLMQQSRQAAMGEMIGNIAHQWRQPLNTIGLYIQGLLVPGECGEFSKEHLEAGVNKAMQVIFHMSQTIDDFRNFFRPDKEMTLFRVDEVVAKTVSLVEGSYRCQQIKVEVKTKGEPLINGYPNEYSQVLLNILINARDAFLEKKIADARVELRVFTEKGKAVVTITDNAGGIPAGILDRIFDPYFTTKGPDKGTGVGLYMSKTIIEKNMNGRLTARNTGNGAEFRIEV
ncbi:MAG: PAS/PAC sensor signal transduction histidine [Geobacteraceae bacterium]|nr:MAG: PAS/PAC sensor signal transduction histidine [Geobacteraceae bacterium]